MQLCSVFSAMLLLGSTMFGPLLSYIPGTFSSLGIIPSTLVLLLFGLLASYSISLMIECGCVVEATSYEDFMEAAFPRYGRIITTLLMNLYLFGVLDGFLDAISEQLDFILKVLTEWNIAHQTSIGLTIVIFCVIFPLCLLGNMATLVFVAFLANLFSLFCILFIGAVSAQQIYLNVGMIKNIPLFTTSTRDVLSAFPMLSLVFMCFPVIYPVWRVLEDPTSKRMNTTQISSLSITALLFTFLGIFGSILLQTSSDTNLLSIFPSTPQFLAIRFIYLLSLISHFPILHFAFRHSIEITFFGKYDWSIPRHILETTLTLVALAVCSIFLTQKIRTVRIWMELLGVLGYPLTFILPVLCYAKLGFYEESRADVDFLEKNIEFVGTKLKRLLVPGMILPTFILILGIAITITNLVLLILDILNHPLNVFSF
uniref:Amino acid transporter transmembrane domain-containing protein n=1 Tax=Arcella intermedia TaxID=1963864 RepID=A0A6B2L4H6_9EUKA